MPVIIKERNVSCIWGGTLTGILLTNDAISTDKINEKTIKIIGIHGWLDNLNSLLPVAQQLIDRHPNYEIYLYDRAGHGFSSHLPQGFNYSAMHNLQDLRTVVQSLRWNKEQFSIIGHSYGAMLGTVYSASYSDEVLCLVAIDALLGATIPARLYWESTGFHIDSVLKYQKRTSNPYHEELTFEKAVESAKTTRANISDEAARLLTERLVRKDTNNKYYFTRDESLKLIPVFPYTKAMFQNILETMKASILFIGATKPQWPHAHRSADLFKKNYPKFEMTLIDGPHHLHMTHVNEVTDRIEEFFDKNLEQKPPSKIEKSKL